MASYLYRYEARGIQRWILATDVLRDLKGGSECVERLGERAEALLGTLGCDVERQVTTAGVGQYIFPAFEPLARFSALWPLVVAVEAPGLELSQAWVALSGSGPADEQAYGELARRLGVAPRGGDVQVPEAGPLSARCGRTGMPAVGSEPVGPSAPELVDAPTARKRRESGGKRLEKRLFGDRAPVMDDDLDGWGASVLGVVHADGNNVGEAFRTVAGGRRKEASDQLSLATARAVAGAVQDLRDREGTRRRGLRVRLVVVGGDDVTAIVPGEHAIPFAAAYLRHFEEAARSVFAAPLTAAAGVALVKTHFPFHMAYGLAEELCAEVKAAFGRGATPRTALAFHRVTTAQLDPWDDISDRLVAKTGARLTRPAYSLDELRDLDELTALFDGVVGEERDERQRLPRGAVREWLRLAANDADRAGGRWRRLCEVTGDAVHGALRGRLEALGAAVETGLGRRATPVGDALSWAMVQRLRQGETRRLWT
ncbi:MAG: hypothetical protein AMXMBFR64_05510 [Myxococcales bacterium]